ncbi:hypothetical protein Bca52824_018876 [Brassica carinata]|uniref:MD-2-related lipid-recognition domain-containing protein n=1 Tax=Brassica carinata TaxID=52824 RepID=A0A8X7VQT2_BRACI|nr:hypothetical protein Bca52824_018876 [Brassica carinata]
MLALRYYPVKVNTVEISPDPVKISTNGNITITGSTSIDISDGATVNLNLRPSLSRVIRGYSLCDIVACPVAACPIVLNFFNVFTQQELTPHYRGALGRPNDVRLLPLQNYTATNVSTLGKLPSKTMFHVFYESDLLILYAW